MVDRLNLLAVVRGHWKGLRHRDGDADLGPDYVARAVLLVGTAVVTLFSFRMGLHLREPGTLFAGLALLSSGLLAAFAQIASIRSRFEVPDDPDFDTERDTRNMLDEGVAHVLLAAVLAAVAAGLLLVSLNVGGVTYQAPPVKGLSPERVINTPFSAAIAGVLTYLFVLFLMTVRKLYAAYVVGNEVADEVSGHHKQAR